MNREGAQKVVMVLVGLLFVAAIYLMGMSLWHPSPSDDTGDTMMMSRRSGGQPAAHRAAISIEWL